MRQGLHLFNAALLFLCASLYLGTGWSLVLFSFPVEPLLTVDNYWMQFVPQLREATRILTVVTFVMLASAAVLFWNERRTVLRWYPIIVFVGVLAAGLVTRNLIFPRNREMAAGITDPERLHVVIREWMALSRLRVGIWTAEWLAMMGYFAHRLVLLERRVMAGQRTVPPMREVRTGRRPVEVLP
ncbi:hypothetical protein JY651_46760 [Pyxidicoccus parkwayensis]|uniref:DUF1772 domain-containing protein n=1 Tax=Pyxidicoccus parkwayensis TaxID=2813578 RepID=A0ABX7PDH9_9BACT|nr:hypothetical protein JY651_46760 [Pyxidicoccus parkwaysis]